MRTILAFVEVVARQSAQQLMAPAVRSEEEMPSDGLFEPEIRRN
jgi:hypothetical protein